MSYGFELGLNSDKSELTKEILEGNSQLFQPIQENPLELFKTGESTNQLVDSKVLPKLELLGDKEVDPEKQKENTSKSKIDKKPSLDRPCPKNEYGKNYDMDSIITPEEACKIRKWIVKQFR